jgi:transposase
MLTPEQKLQIIKWYYGGKSIREISSSLFVLAFDKELSHSSVENVIKNLENNFCLQNCSHCRKQPQPENEDDEMKEIMVCSMIDNDDTLSSRAIAETVGISHSKVLKILHTNGLSCYKVQTNQELFEEDKIRRMEFCEDVMERANNENNLLSNILFSDESSFPIHGRQNPSVVRYWSQENQHRTLSLRTQYPQKLNVWAGILGDNIIGPFFIDGNLNGAKYLQLLQNNIIPAVLQLQNVDINRVWYQHDGCPAHNAAREYLNTIFPNRVISRDGTIKWPPRSPDLTPLDFFIWGYIKETIYQHQHERAINLDELRNKILNAFQNINPEMLQNARTSFYNRLGYCLAQEGYHFEHLI